MPARPRARSTAAALSSFPRASRSAIALLAACAALVGLAAASPARAEDEIRWIQLTPSRVAGYTVFLGRSPGVYVDGVDVGFVPADPDGLTRLSVAELETLARRSIPVLDGDTVHVAMTAYDAQGTHSALSNEIRVVLQPCSRDADCDDANRCNGFEVCRQGSCVAGKAPACASDDPCQIGSCDPLVGCRLTPRPDGATCNDGDPDTLGDVCRAGTCRGVSATAAIEIQSIKAWPGTSVPAGTRVYLTTTASGPSPLYYRTWAFLPDGAKRLGDFAKNSLASFEGPDDPSIVPVMVEVRSGTTGPTTTRMLYLSFR